MQSILFIMVFANDQPLRLIYHLLFTIAFNAKLLIYCRVSKQPTPTGLTFNNHGYNPWTGATHGPVQPMDRCNPWTGAQHRGMQAQHAKNNKE